jgi:hypothetical protein
MVAKASLDRNGPWRPPICLTIANRSFH